jgi:hypothetical protein
MILCKYEVSYGVDDGVRAGIKLASLGKSREAKEEEIILLFQASEACHR